MRLVIIHWRDAISQAVGWKALDKVRDLKPAKCKSVGWLVHEAPDFVTLVSSQVEDGDCDGDVLILRGMIDHIEELKS